MFRYPRKVALLFLSIGSLWFAPVSLAQAKAAVTPSAGSGLSPDKAITLAEQGHCQESISALKRATTAQLPAETKKRAGIVGIRCSLALDDRDSAVDFVRSLNRQFGRDPDVLFVLVHAYSDLSTRTAQDLGRTAPQSLAAHKLNAEALEMQGKWEPAQLEYEGILEKHPDAVGIHFLLGRSLLSQPNASPENVERARQEFQKEIQIDPNNAGAHYILGELARRDEKWDEAISQFSEATKLDPSFADAYLNLGASLISVKRYEEAIPPLRVAERLQPGNPGVHYNLGVAFSRTGKKEEADKEFAIHRQLTEKPAPGVGKTE
jgi:tetratricopeptide (TPR) repeat protein